MINKIFDELLSRYIHWSVKFQHDLSKKEERYKIRTYAHGILDCLEKLNLINEKEINIISDKMYYFAKYKG